MNEKNVMNNNNNNNNVMQTIHTYLSPFGPKSTSSNVLFNYLFIFC